MSGEAIDYSAASMTFSAEMDEIRRRHGTSAPGAEFVGDTRASAAAPVSESVGNLRAAFFPSLMRRATQLAEMLQEHNGAIEIPRGSSVGHFQPRR